MCLNAVLGSAKAKIENAIQVERNTITTKTIFILRIKGLIYSFNSFLNLNRFFVKVIWARISNKINKVIINLLVVTNQLESKSKPKKVACNAKNIQESIFIWNK